MIGRAAQGRPWIFRDTDFFFETNRLLDAPSVSEVATLLCVHLDDHYGLYGEFTGVRSARKHIGWYTEGLPNGESFRDELNLLDNTAAQFAAVQHYFSQLADRYERLPVEAYRFDSSDNLCGTPATLH
jgi:tRNA-dihydrouridine synthase B